MKSQAPGRNISKPEVVNISSHGIWMDVGGVEYFMPYKEYPWFQKVTVSEIYNVQLLHGRHLYWPDLDVDLDTKSLGEPEKYPLIYR